MAPPAAHTSHQSPQAAAPTSARTWPLSAGRAMALHASHACTLQVHSGCVWVTLDGPHTGAANDSGDVFLNAGTTLRVPAGQRVVLEALHSTDGDVAQLRWSRVAPAYGVLGALGFGGALAVLRGAALGAMRGALAGARAARAASNASRAQGAMACGESMASSGAL
jgi:hypothetical protein